MSGTSIIAQFSMPLMISYAFKDRNFSNNTGTTHYDSLQGSYWADQKDSHNKVIMTSLQGQ